MTTCDKTDYNSMRMVTEQLSKIIDVESSFSISEGRFEKLISKRVPSCSVNMRKISLVRNGGMIQIPLVNLQKMNFGH